MSLDLIDIINVSCSCSIMAVEELQYVFDTNEISEQFMQLCAWICSQLKDYCSIQETVTGFVSICCFKNSLLNVFTIAIVFTNIEPVFNQSIVLHHFIVT